MPPLPTVCLECGCEFLAQGLIDLCPRCQRREDAVFANDPTPIVLEAPRRYSRAWMQELLGVSGDEDA